MALGELFVFGSELGWPEGRLECGVPPPELQLAPLLSQGMALGELLSLPSPGSASVRGLRGSAAERAKCCSDSTGKGEAVCGSSLSFSRGEQRPELVPWPIWRSLLLHWASLVAQTVKDSPVMQETWVRSLGQEDPLEKGKGYPLQYSCLENSMDRGAWWATVHGLQRVRHD